MAIMTKFLKLFIVGIFIASVLSGSHIAGATNSITDPPDDVGEITYGTPVNGTTNQPTYQTVTNHPNVDILSASYTKNNNGSITLELTVKGIILTDNHSFYNIVLTTNSSTNYFQINTYYGNGYQSNAFGTAGVDIIPGIQFQYTNSTQSFVNDNTFKIGHGPMHSYVQGSHLFMTLSNNITASTNENSTLIYYPTNFPDSWQWAIITWQGGNYLNASGNWYMDYYPNSANKWTSLPAPITPGFEVYSIIAIPIVFISLKKLKLKNNKE